MDESKISKGQSTEKTDGRRVNEPGIYKHRDTKAIFITAQGEEGSIQADALLAPIWKDAWYRESDVPSRLQLVKIRKTQEIKDAKDAAILKKAEKAEIDEAVASVK